MQRSAKPDSHVQYASHLYQCSGFGSFGGATRNLWIR